MSASEALIDFAVQANISIGGVNACRGTTAGLSGRFTVEDGLTRLLAKTGCGFRRVAPDTVRVFALSRPAPPAPAAPGPGSRQAPAVDLPDTPEVVVTTTKRAAMIGSLPYAVSALNQSQLEEAGALDVGDVAVQIPGLSTTNLGLGRDKILLRGLSDGVFTGRTQSTVGITYNAPDPDLQLADVEAIEVMRGPQGALYGGGAISGIYRIITNKPSLDAWSGYARAGASLTNAGAPSQEYEAMVNAPLSVDQIGVRAVAYKTVDGGYIDESALRLNNVDQTVREGGRAPRSGMNEGPTRGIPRRRLLTYRCCRIAMPSLTTGEPDTATYCVGSKPMGWISEYCTADSGTMSCTFILPAPSGRYRT